MDHKSPEILEEEMRETRAALADKVATLELRVVDTFQSATDTIKTVENTVKDTVLTVKSAVTDSVHSASVLLRETFDVSKQIRERPWTMVSGSFATGVLAGLLLRRRNNATEARRESTIPSRPLAEAAVSLPPVRTAAKISEPTFVDHLWERIRGEIDKIAENTITTVSHNLQQSIDSGVPKLMDDLVQKSQCETPHAATNGRERTKVWN